MQCLAAHLYSGGSGCVRWRVRVLPLFCSYHSPGTLHTSPSYLSSGSLTLPGFLSFGRGRRGPGPRGEGAGLEHRSLFVWDLFIWFPSACILNTLCHNIFSYSIQGPVGPLTVYPPLFIFAPFFPAKHISQRQPKKERNYAEMCSSH